jgi:hypothetical protein
VKESEPKGFVVNIEELPMGFPTHKHPSEFLEALGRTVATFGFLEETLGKAIFAFTATRRIPPNDIDAEFEKWLPTLERALIDPLAGLITSYAKAVRAHNSAEAFTNLDDLMEKLRKVSVIRNVLCHGSWRTPDEWGRSLPLFVNKNKEIFQMPIDVAYLKQMQRYAAGDIGGVELAILIMGDDPDCPDRPVAGIPERYDQTFHDRGRCLAQIVKQARRA